VVTASSSLSEECGSREPRPSLSKSEISVSVLEVFRKTFGGGASEKLFSESVPSLSDRAEVNEDRGKTKERNDCEKRCVGDQEKDIHKMALQAYRHLLRSARLAFEGQSRRAPTLSPALPHGLNYGLATILYCRH
jgi:hypothetical protein